MKKIYGVLAVALAVGLAGCGSSNQAAGGSPRTKLISAVDQTSNSQSARLNTVVKSSGASAVTITADGVYDFKKKQGTQTEQVSSGTSGQISLETVLDGTNIYEKLPAALVGSSASAKPWVKIDLTSVSKEAGFDLGSLTAGQSGDPTRGLSMLLAAGNDVTTVGKEKIRGAQTTHYKTNLDFNKAAAAETDATRKAALQKLSAVYGGAVIPVDVWVDADNRVRKLSYAVDTSKINLATSSTTSPAANVGSLSFTLEMYDFGTPVNVTVPSPDQVGDISSIGGVGGSAAS